MNQISAREVPATIYAGAGTALIIALTAAATGFAIATSSTTTLSLALTGLVFCGVTTLFLRSPTKSIEVVLRPSGVAALLTFVCVIVVPITWSAGIAAPWPDVAGYEARAISLGLCFAGVLAIAVIVSTRRSYPDEYERPHAVSKPSPSSVLRTSTVIGVAGLGAFLLLAGGPRAAIAGLHTRREFFAGLGPLVAVAMTPGAALVHCIHTGAAFSRAAERVSVAVAALCFLTTVWFTGQKSYVVLLLVMILIAGGARRRANRVFLFLALTALVPAATLYQYEVRQRMSIGHTEGFIDTASATSFIRTSWSPFASSGLDQLRTISAAAREADLVSFNPSPLLAAPLTLAPRSLWPSKPEAASLRFSKEYFPEHFVTGTGIPPSLPAELIWEFGIAGGLIVFSVVMVLLVLVERFLRKGSPRSFRFSLYPVFGAAVFTAMKAGSDSGMRIFLLFGIAMGVVLLIPKVRNAFRFL